MKLDKSKKIMALILTSTLLFPNVSFASENRINTYLDEGKFIINDYGNFELRISEDKLDNLIEDGSGFCFNIGDKEINLDSDTLKKLRKEALDKQDELNNYKMIIYTSFGVIAVLIIRGNIKKMTKKKR